MKRFLAILCALAMLLSVLPSAAFAAENSDLQVAMDDDSSEIIVLEEDTSNITVNRDTYLDLNGYDLDGVSVLAGTLYIMDSATADYTVADGIYGHVTDVTGAVKAADGYLQVGDSFHAVNLDIYAMTLRASDVGVYYKSHFAADEIVAAEVESFGVALSVVTAPSASNLETYCGYSEFTGFEAGEGANSVGTSTLLKGIMKAANGDEKNAKNAAMPVYGRAYIKTADGYFFGETVKRSLQEQVEAIDGVWETLSDAQKAPVLSMLERYTAVMENWNIPNIQGIQVPGADEEIEIPIEVTAENGIVTEGTTVEENGVSITVPAGTKLAENATGLTVIVTEKETSDAGLTLDESEVLMPMDVHVDGLAADNAQPLTIYLGKVMAENLNMGNYAVYHVENGKANEMVLIPATADFTAHNQYKYSLDGELTLYMATFSEVAVVSEEPKWEGKRDYSWYNTTDTVLYIRNADQLAAFGAIVGGMAKTADQVEIEQDTFAGKTVVLLADISIGDLTDEDGRNVVFYPIGYYNSTGSYEKVSGGSVSSNVSSFEGTFDGNGNTISDFYQNTWEMFGDYNSGYSGTPNHYKDAMGLFGYVLNGTVKNLTVRNFKSDGEFTPTGVIAAYACNSTFENIAIVKCNPRVYNTGNGGIIGIAGNNGDQNTEILLKNITVDNSNKISALWGSWDVACGGLVGMFRGNAEGGNGKIHFENCHVAAQIDVYNDVCANYQYYAYRYSGMMIGSVRHNQTIDGHVYPNMAGISAKGCTVHFGTWNDYYYCELVDNTTASYTHDYQMSRLVEVKAIDGTTITYLDNTTGTVPASGRTNYVIVDYTKGHGTENATCHHFLNGEVWTHDMGGIQTGIDENGDGKDDLKEDKQHIYREFNNLFTGYGWGVTTKAISDFAEKEIKILDKALDGGSADKFLQAENFRGEKPYPAGAAIRLEDLFQENETQSVPVIGANVQVTVSPVDENGTVKATYTPNYTDWTKGTLTFDKDFEGAALVTITDYYFCNPLILTVNVTKYTADLYFEDLENKTAYCPVCGDKVTWTEIAGSEGTDTAYPRLSREKHYYLGGNVKYTGETGEKPASAYILGPNALNGIGSATGEEDVGVPSCLHLNGYGITSTDARNKTVIFGGNAGLNVMGTGTVESVGSEAADNDGGSAIVCNTVGFGSVHLYGGTYRSDANSSAYAVAINGTGGKIRIYKDAVVDGGNKKYAIKVDKASLRATELQVTGAEINGNISVINPAKATSGDYAKDEYPYYAGAAHTTVKLDGAVVSGTVSVNYISVDTNNLEFEISGNATIGNLNLQNDAKLTLGELTEGAKIGVSATAEVPFTVANTNAAAYRKYFYATADAQIVKAVNDQLVCVTPTYTDNLEFKANGKAYCAACGEVVEWTVLTDQTTKLQKAGANNVHYYLATDVEYKDISTGNTTTSLSGPQSSVTKEACLHLNGKTLSSEDRATIFGSSGILNVLGSGTVLGGKTGSNMGTAVIVNSYTSGVVNLFSGTYKDRSTTTNGKYVVSINSVGGIINIYEDVEIISCTGKAINVDTANMRSANLYVEGAQITGNVNIKSPLGYLKKEYPDNTNFNTAGQSNVTFNGTKINGTVTVDNVITPEEATADIHPAHQKFILSGAAEISQLVLTNKAKVTLEADWTGTLALDTSAIMVDQKVPEANLTVTGGVLGGTVTDLNGNQLTYVNGQLGYHPTAQTSYCRACQADVVWESVAEALTLYAPIGVHYHYYVPEDMTLADPGELHFYIVDNDSNIPNKANTVCLYLNGKTLTLTEEIYNGFSSTLNIIGDGQIVGAAKKEVFDNYTGTINLYGGTYTAGQNGKVAKMLTTGSIINAREDAWLQGEFAMSQGKLWLYGTATISDLNITGGLTTFCSGWTGVANLRVAEALMTNGVVSTANAKVQSTAAGTITSTMGDVTVDVQTGAITITTDAAEE